MNSSGNNYAQYMSTSATESYTTADISNTMSSQWGQSGSMPQSANMAWSGQQLYQSGNMPYINTQQTSLAAINMNTQQTSVAAMNMNVPQMISGASSTLGMNMQQTGLTMPQAGIGMTTPQTGFRTFPAQMDTGVTSFQIGTGMTAPQMNLGITAINMTTSNMGPGMTASQLGSGVTAPQMGPGMTAPHRGPGLTAPQMGFGISTTNMTTSNMGHGMTTPQIGPRITAPQMGTGMTANQMGSGMTANQMGPGMTTNQIGPRVTAPHWNGKGMFSSQNIGMNPSGSMQAFDKGTHNSSGGMNMQQLSGPGQGSSMCQGSISQWAGNSNTSGYQTGMRPTSGSGTDGKDSSGYDYKQELNRGSGYGQAWNDGNYPFQQGSMNSYQQDGSNTCTEYQQKGGSNADLQGPNRNAGCQNWNTSYQKSALNQQAASSRSQQSVDYTSSISYDDSCQTSLKTQYHNRPTPAGEMGSAKGSFPNQRPNFESSKSVNEEVDQFYAALVPGKLEENQSNAISSTTQPSKYQTVGKTSQPAHSSTPMSNSVVHQEADSSTQSSKNINQEGKPLLLKPKESESTVSVKFDDEDTEYCKLCNIYFTSVPLYALHTRGVSHIQRLLAVDQGQGRKALQNPCIVSGKSYTQTVLQDKIGVYQVTKPVNVLLTKSLPVPTATTFCHVCQLDFCTEDQLRKHIMNDEHKKASMEKSKKNSDKDLEVIENDFHLLFRRCHPSIPVVGLQHIIQYAMPSGKVPAMYFCSICYVKSDEHSMCEHAIGTRHRLSVLKECNVEAWKDVMQIKDSNMFRESVARQCNQIEAKLGRGVAHFIKNFAFNKMEVMRAKVLYEKEQELRRDGHFVTKTGETIAENPSEMEQPTTTVTSRQTTQHLKKEQKSLQMSEAERKLAVESLKRTLLNDFKRRNIEPELANKILESRLELLQEYERRGVPFVVARERVIEEEERWNLLLEFERQSLPFEEAEQRIDHRFELLKMHQKNGVSSEDARRRVLDDEVIHDFRDEFVQLGLPKCQAQKQAEKRLWMLEHLHYQGLSPEEASQKVIAVEKEVKRSIALMLDEEKEKQENRRTDSVAQWMLLCEDLNDYILKICQALSLSKKQHDAMLSVVQNALEMYRKARIPPTEAKCRVLVDDLPIPSMLPEEPIDEPACDPGSKADISARIDQFVTKLQKNMQIMPEKSNTEEETSSAKAVSQAEEPEKKEECLAEYDRQSRLEIQNLLADMLKMSIPSDEARKRLVALYKRHESLRKNLFPWKPSRCSNKTKNSDNQSSLDKDLTKEEQKIGPSTDTQPSERPAADNQLASITDGPKENKQGDLSVINMSQSISVDAEQHNIPSASNIRSGEKEMQVMPVTESADKVLSYKEIENQLPRNQSMEEMKLNEQVEQATSSQLLINEGAKFGSDSTADDRWKMSVEMFLQQYGLKKDNIDRYSPSNISPRHSRSSSFSPSIRRHSSRRSRSRSLARKSDSPGMIRKWTRLCSTSSGRRSRRSSSPRRLRSRSPVSVRSRSPCSIISRSPVSMRSRSPVSMRSRSPGSIRSRSSHRIRSRSPCQIRSRSPRRIRSRSPHRIRSRSPCRIRSRSPGRMSGSHGILKSKSLYKIRSNSPGLFGFRPLGRYRSRSPKNRSSGFIMSRYSDRISKSPERTKPRSPGRSRSPGMFRSRSPRRLRSRSPERRVWSPISRERSPVLKMSPSRRSLERASSTHSFGHISRHSFEGPRKRHYLSPVNRYGPPSPYRRLTPPRQAWDAHASHYNRDVRDRWHRRSSSRDRKRSPYREARRERRSHSSDSLSMQDLTDEEIFRITEPLDAGPSRPMHARMDRLGRFQSPLKPAEEPEAPYQDW